MSARVALFVHYDKDNLIEEYVAAYVRGLKTVAREVYFISNCQPSAKELEKVIPYVKEIRLRPNEGNDFGAWKEVLLDLGLTKLSENYTELILANDSCYAPFFPLQEMFNVMENKKYDMWGITENRDPEFRCETGKTVPVPPHIQSYFLVFNQTILASACFFDFWQKIDKTTSRDNAIVTGETFLTQWLEKHHFHCGAYLPYQPHDLATIKKMYRRQKYDLSLFYWPMLLERRCPFLKVKAIPMTLGKYEKNIEMCSSTFVDISAGCTFQQVKKHLNRVSAEYQFYYFRRFKKLLILLAYCFGLLSKTHPGYQCFKNLQRRIKIKWRSYKKIKRMQLGA